MPKSRGWPFVNDNSGKLLVRTQESGFGKARQSAALGSIHKADSLVHDSSEALSLAMFPASNGRELRHLDAELLRLLDLLRIIGEPRLSDGLLQELCHLNPDLEELALLLVGCVLVLEGGRQHIGEDLQSYWKEELHERDDEEGYEGNQAEKVLRRSLELMTKIIAGP